MIIGIPREIKDYEYRVGATPSMVQVLIEAGHRVLVETKAGFRVGFTDEMYADAGADVVSNGEDVYRSAEMIVKVKEPQSSEFSLLREELIIFSFLHLAANPEVAEAMLAAKAIGIAYETITDSRGGLPLLQPMSEIAGRLAVQAGAAALEMLHGGRGVLLGGVPGVPPGKVVIIGGGVVGTEAARMALGLGANVVVMDKDLHRLRELDTLFGPRLKTLYSTPSTLEEAIITADLVIGAVLIPGGKAPKLIKSELIKKMQFGAAIVDVSIDQGGCVEGVHPTTHADPTFIVDNIVHYCVSNIPAACARTATLALTNATLQTVLTIANEGYQAACVNNEDIRHGLNVFLGKVTNEPVARDLGHQYHDAITLL